MGLTQMLLSSPSNASKAFVKHLISAAAWIACSCTVVFASAVKVTDRNALSEPCSIVSSEEAQFVLGLTIKPRSHHRWVSDTEVRTACDFVAEVAQPVVLRVIKMEFANEFLARDYLTPADEPHQSDRRATADAYSYRVGKGGQAVGRKANVVIVLVIFPARGSDRTSSQVSDGQFKRLLELRQQVLSRL